MPRQNTPSNTIYQHDNLPVLRGTNTQTIDLIATDPPFNTNCTRAAPAGTYTDK